MKSGKNGSRKEEKQGFSNLEALTLKVNNEFSHGLFNHARAELLKLGEISPDFLINRYNFLFNIRQKNYAKTKF